jgi:hypothetical protein
VLDPSSANPYGNQFEVGVSALGPRYGNYRGGQCDPKDANQYFMCWNETGPNRETFPLHFHVKEYPLYGRFFEIGTCYYESDQEDQMLRGLYWGRYRGKGMKMRMRRD